MKRTTERLETRRKLASAFTIKAVVASVLTVGTVNADLGDVEFTAPISPKPLYDRLEIVSDGTQYVGTADGVGRIDTDIHLSLDAGLFGRIKSWRVWIQSAVAANIEKGWIDLPEDLEESYPLGSRPKNVMGSFGLPVSFSSFGASFCNLMASDLRRQGYNNADIFAVNRYVSLTLRPALSYEMTGPASLNDAPQEVATPGSESWGDLELICLAHSPVVDISDEGPQRDPLASIAYANLALAFNDQPTECPTEVIAQALFTSPHKGRFTVRLRDAYGHASQPIELRMRESDRNGSYYVKTLYQGFMVGDTETQGGNVRPPVEPIGGELTTEPLEPPPIAPDRGPGQGAPDQLADHAGDPNEHVNSVWVEIMDAGLGSVTETDHEEYRVHCQNFLDPGDRGPTEIGKGIQQSVEPWGIKGARVKSSIQ